MKPVIFYHDKCSDGFFGAWAAWKKFGASVEYRGLSHEIHKLPSDVSGKDITFIDYCLPGDLFSRLKKKARHVTVIDHHITHRDVGAQADENTFALNKSGCVLAWEYFHPRKKVPALLRVIQDYDLFTLKLKKTREVITALELHERTFKGADALVRDFEKPAFRKSLELLGHFLLEYKEVFVGRLLEIATPVIFHGHKAYAVNTHTFYSETGARLYQEKDVHLGIAWYYKNGRIKISLRSDGKVNCAQLAAQYGGGGHVGAAGFWIDFDGTFPWKGQ
ncbi:MAG: hypothetical protein AAB855_01295 [Patescibacteria group bacterium]